MDYEEAEALLNRLEADQEKKAVTIDLKQALSESIETKQYDEKEVGRTVEMLDSFSTQQAQKAQQQRPQRAQAKAAPQAQRQAPAVEAEQRPSPKITNVGQQGSKQMFSRQEIGSIASDLHTMFGGMRGKRQVKKAGPQQVDTKALILANLSLQDQLTELEKISLGIDKSIFNSSQLEIIKYEIRGLNAARKLASEQNLDKGLVQLRDARLKEVINKLGIK